ncbi:MAG: HEAT repeat domain-containing protein [Verrucomicrobia bacterium]|nr:HEAT repeat domain-containing protein [Verrucomicrobiota bacterium]
MTNRYFSAICILALSTLAQVNAIAQPAPSDWRLINVPGAWEVHGPPAAKNHDGFAWYRTWLKPSDSFFTKHERNLFEESVTVNIRDLADAHELYVNGKKIGAGGQFPPNFRSGKDQIHRHKVPVGTLRRGEWNEIALRVYNSSGPGGFVSEAPFIMDYFMECVFEGPWQFRLGDDSNWVGGPLTNRPVTTAFDQFHESNRVLGEAAQIVTGPRLPPNESLAKMQPADDLVVEDVLHEPIVAQPVHFSFDERGRMWLTQYRQYPYPAGLKMLSRDKYYRAHYDRVPAPPPNHDRGRDIVSIHEDSDGDGQFDRHKVFLEGLNLANAAVRGRGGVWVMHTPYLLFYPDRDFDDVPDGPPVVHLQGFGFEDTHSVANGLVWGMDGWLYGGQGSTTSSRVTRPGMDPPNAPGVWFEGCMVWRYHPEMRAYEIFAEGSGNTFGLEVDAQGRLFSGHNGGTTRGWHYVQGGFYLKQGFDPGKFGPARNPYTFGQLPMMKSDSTVQRFSHFAAVVEGTAFPWRYAGMFCSVDPLHNVVIASERRGLGATFSTLDVGPVLSSGDVAFRPVYIANAADGALYLADFYEYYIAHGQHYQNQIDRTTGRIYRLRGKDRPLERDLDLSRKSTEELLSLLSHPNKWHRHTAVRLFGERKDPGARPKLKRLIDEEKGLTALCALWALHQIDGLEVADVLTALNHSYAAVRLWAVRLAGDQWGTNPGLGLKGRHALPEAVPPARAGVSTGASSKPTAGAPLMASEASALAAELFQAVLQQTKREADPEVRSQIASSARRLASSQALPIVAELLGHDEDLNDAYLPLLCWWVLEAHASEHREEILGLFAAPRLWDRPMVFEHILPRLMRRYALEGRRQDLLTCARLLRMAPSPRHSLQLMKGFEEAYRGRAMADLPKELMDAIDSTGPSPLIVRVRRGDPMAVAEAIDLVKNSKARIEDRLLYTRSFGEVRPGAALPALLNLVPNESQNSLRKAALAALSAYENESIGDSIIAALPKLPTDVRTSAFAVLASRANWSLKLLQAVQSGQVQPSIIPEDAVDRMRSQADKSSGDLVEKLFPKQGAVPSSAYQRRMADVEAILKRSAGNPYNGEAIFLDRCAGCHKLFFKGGKVGPDLTNYQRDNLGTMLMSLVNPNAEIREGYEYYLVETNDRRSLSGFLADRDTQVTVLRGLEGEDITLRASEIKNIQPMGRSLMPEGLLDDLDDKQLRDLFAYLRISQPISR